jgi:hypothetical protein
MAITRSDIRNRAHSWIEGRTTFRQFEDWFVPATWNVDKVGNPDIEQLADMIDLYMSEYTDGVLGEDELKGEVAKLIGYTPQKRLVSEPRFHLLGQRPLRTYAGALK